MTSRRLSLRKAPAPAPAAPPVEEPVGRQGKGRPTPKRSEAERRRGGPVAPPPATRREAARRLREQQAEDRKAGRSRPQSARVLARDAGPVREFVRDVIDSRHNLAVIMLPVALIYVISSFLGNARLLSLVMRLFTLALVLVLVDSALIAFTVRSRVRGQFPDERTRGHVVYGLMRSTVFRRMRMPPARTRPPSFRRR